MITTQPARYLLLILYVMLVCAALPASAQQEVFHLDPAASRVEFTLGDILHTVHGSFQLKRGTLRLDPAKGTASGELVVDATSGDSGSKGRDRKMHRDILESQKYPEITFVPQHIAGTLAPQGTSQITLQGLLTLHGQAHPMTITMPVQVQGSSVSGEAKFIVPYVKWGLKNPSTWFLRVSDKVEITVHAVGELTKQAAANSTAASQ